MSATYPVTQVVETGPRNRSVQYVIRIPANAACSDYAQLGPIDVEPGTDSFGLAVFGATNSALTVQGTFDGPSLAPTARSWMTMRGDMTVSQAPSLAGGDVGINKLLLAVTAGGHILVRGPARSFRFRISGASSFNNEIVLTAICIRPNW